MKIRIADNELRFRIGAQDLLLLKEKKELVTACTISGAHAFYCMLNIERDLKQPLLKISEYRLQLYLPHVITSQWLASEENITLYKNFSLPNSPTILTVEKDLPCKH